MVYFPKFSKNFFLFVLIISNSIINTVKAETYYTSMALSASLFVGLGCFAGMIDGKIKVFENFLTNKLIDTWIANNNLNHFGDPKDTTYAICPLGQNETHYDFIKCKFPKQPWLKSYKPVFSVLKSINSKTTTMLCGFLVMELLTFLFMAATDTGYKRADFDMLIKELRYKIDHTPTYDAGYVC